MIKGSHLLIYIYSVFYVDGCDRSIYRVLDDPQRSPNYHIPPDSTDNLLCDDLLPPGWYRLMEKGRHRSLCYKRCFGCNNLNTCRWITWLFRLLQNKYSISWLIQQSPPPTLWLHKIPSPRHEGTHWPKPGDYISNLNCWFDKISLKQYQRIKYIH